MKKIIAIILALVLVLSFAACKKKSDDKTLKVGANITPHAEILREAAKLLEKEGYKLEVVEYTDYVQPNTAVEDGSLDANYFQHTPYLDWFNEEYDTHIVSVGAIHYEPFGIYPGRVKALSDLPDGAKIGVPNDGSNETRALLLLQQEGLIKLKEGIDASSNATVLDVAENPHNIEIIEMEAAQVPKSLADLDFGVINGNFALQNGLNAGKDALAVEDASGSGAQTYANVLCVKEGNEKNEAVLALFKALTSEEVKAYINNTYQGAVVPIF
jgi:D-methionine transport system substrate-binding protein